MTHEWCAPGIVPAIDTLQDVDAEVAATWIEAFERDEHVFIRSVDRIPDDEADLREILAAHTVQALAFAQLATQAVLGEMVALTASGKELAVEVSVSFVRHHVRRYGFEFCNAVTTVAVRRARAEPAGPGRMRAVSDGDDAS